MISWKALESRPLKFKFSLDQEFWMNDEYYPPLAGDKQISSLLSPESCINIPAKSRTRKLLFQCHFLNINQPAAISPRGSEVSWSVSLLHHCRARLEITNEVILEEIFFCFCCFNMTWQGSITKGDAGDTLTLNNSSRNESFATTLSWQSFISTYKYWGIMSGR